MGGNKTKTMRVHVPEHEKYFTVMHNMPTWLSEQRKRFGRVIYLKCRSLSAFHQYAKNAGENLENASGKVSRSGWYGTETWTEYIELLDSGDEAVMKKIKDQTAHEVRSLERKYEKTISHYKFDVTGETFDIGLVLSGEPEHWLEPVYIETEGETPQIKLNINLGAPNKVEVQNFIDGGAKILSLVTVLERMGAQVEVVGFSLVKDVLLGGKRSLTIISSIVLKNTNEALNYKKLSSILTPAHFRRGCVRLYETLSDELFMTLDDEGYGYAQNNIDNLIDMTNLSQIEILEEQLFKERSDK